MIEGVRAIIWAQIRLSHDNIGGDTSDRRREGHDMSQSSDHPMTGGDALGEGVRAMIGAQLQNTPEPMWWLNISGQVYE